ncbi:unnamed protein product [Effrenium voratum]|uniref:Uncharacterized protein n=1 Tax=Effrenium voratum TaxID=2562239 RepID=A0AA36INC8_9DINO|nr:unnamed protein product [Effrenium voratum]
MVPILLRESSELDAAASLVEWPFILPHEFVRTLVAEGYLNVLVGDVKDIPGFWEHFLKDFPDHPAADGDKRLRSLGFTLYCDEAQSLNDNWMHLIFTSDLSPYLTDAGASRFLMTIFPESRYVLNQDTGVNETLQGACQIIADSFNKLANEGVDLREFPSEESILVATLHCFITGFRGDWKALKQVFNLRRHASTDEICWLCKACKGLDDDQSPLIFTDARDSAAFWGTIGLEDPWSQSPSYATLVGFSGPGMIHADLLHVYHLGVGRDACGALLKLMMSKYPTVFFEGNNIPAKMQAATKQLKEYAALHKLPLRMKRFSKAKISWKKKSFPELKSSSYDTYVISRWLGHVLSLAQGRNDEINKWATMMWAINLVLSLLSRAGRWLTPEEQDNKVVVGKIFVTIYLSLAFDSIQNNERCWRVRPKLHLLHHILLSSPQSFSNPNSFSTWMDEDSLKKQMKVLRKTDPRSAQLRMLQRWLLALPQKFDMCNKKGPS